MTPIVYTAPATCARFMKSESFGRLIAGPVGCLPGDSEFLTPTGWKRMDAWLPGDQVAVWNAGQVSFEAAEYVDLPADAPFHVFDSGSLRMELSSEHKVLYLDYRGVEKTCTAAAMARQPSRRTIPTAFSISKPDAPITDSMIRFRVMFCADGRAPKAGQQVKIIVRKDRKKDRLRAMLPLCGMAWKESTSTSRVTETTFWVRWDAPSKSMDFVWGLSPRQLAIVLDELDHWDGLHAHAEKRFTGSDKAHADAIQYAAHATGRRAVISIYKDPRNRAWKPIYTVNIRTGDNIKNRAMVRAETRIGSRVSPDGRKYCFATSTGYFVARCNDTVFVTGNSGKTTACIFEIFRRACAQTPAPDGYRYTRFAIVRQTLKQLKDTVLKDITAWLDGVAEYKVSDSTVYIRVGDIRSEWLLIPLDDPTDQRRLLSMQLTGAWMSECIEMDVGIVSPLAGRVGRYPAANLGGASWMGIIADTNMPAEGTPWHELMAINTPPDWQIFIQPSGMSAAAENLEWLTQNPETLKLAVDDPIRISQGRTYYERFIRSNTPDWCKRYVHAQYGDDPSGSAVFRETFRQHWHVVDDLEPIASHPLIVGLDFGRDPCAIICQPDHRGRLLVLEEIIAEDIGLELQLARSLRPTLLQERYIGKPVVVIGDPAGIQRSTIYEETSFDVVKRNGLNAYPAPTNDIDRRIAAVEGVLLGSRDGGPAVLIDRERCPTLIRALSGGYRYGRTRAGQRKPTPDKNKYSHIMDAFQYACLVTHGGMGEMIFSRLRRPATSNRVRITSGAWT